ncbi:MAG: VWA domain-containing protein [Sphaerochaetaceae bacterium]|nr:VWA domain-containing protein [Sphaerochaetaceae bacterium]
MKVNRYYVALFLLVIQIVFFFGCASGEDSDVYTEIAVEPQDVSPSPMVSAKAMAAPLLAADSATEYPVTYPADSMNTEEYDRITDNPFRNATEHPVSTFSIDADTASYTNVRRYLTQNNALPPEDAVRIEELLQYFSYDYPQPEGEHPISYTLDMEQAPWNLDHQLLRVALKAEQISTEELPPSNLVFLIDTSGSMRADNKLPLLQKSMKVLVKQLRAQDSVSIVAYAGSAGVILKNAAGTEKQTIIRAFTDLKASGATAGEAGIELAYTIAQEHYIPGGNNRVILCTDGDFNVGVSSTGALERLIEHKREQNIYLTILGLGMGNYKDSRMEALSNIGNGNYAYIDNLLEGKKVLGKEIWGNMFTVAKDVKVQIEFNPAIVESYRLIGYENRMLQREDFNDDTKDAGEMGFGQTVTAFYELVLTSSESSQSSPVQSDPLVFQSSTVIPSEDLLSLKIRYKRPQEGKESSQLIDIMMDEDELTRPSDMSDPDFTFASAVVEFGMLLRDSPYKGSSSWDQVLQLAKASRGDDEEGYRAEFIRLAELAQLLEDN